MITVLNDFEKLATKRRSAIKFIEGEVISQEEWDQIFNMVKLSPSCFNLQHAEYLVIQDKGRKQILKELSFNQYKVGVASAAVIVLGNKEAYKHVEEIYSGMKMLGMMSEKEFNETVSTARGMYENNPSFQKEEAIRNASLSAMTFMYAAESLGFQTCPMIGFQPEAVKEAFNIPDNLEPVLLITIGKADRSKERKRGFRKPNSQFVTYEVF